MASSNNQPLAIPVPVTPIGVIPSTSYSPTVGVELRQDYTELMPTVSNQTLNLCSISDIVHQVFMSYVLNEFHYNLPLCFVCLCINLNKKKSPSI